MTTLLQINTSLFAGNGQSTRLADRFVAAWCAGHSDTEVILRDLARDPVPHLDDVRFGAFIAKPEDRDPAQQAAVAYSDALIAELERADVIVLGLPMYNFGIPSQLKAYFDHVARAGVTFRYTADGPVGLLSGKTAYVLAARGGVYAGTALDSETAYVRDFLRFVGIEEVEFVYAEGLNISEDDKQTGLTQAQHAIARLTTAQRLIA